MEQIMLTTSIAQAVRILFWIIPRPSIFLEIVWKSLKHAFCSFDGNFKLKVGKKRIIMIQNY